MFSGAKDALGGETFDSKHYYHTKAFHDPF